VLTKGASWFGHQLAPFFTLITLIKNQLVRLVLFSQRAQVGINGAYCVFSELAYGFPTRT
jgi:hypothetical protein